ncbi:MAG: hypothetical protein UR50_C0003G0030 [Parcubacteria group bacterium GW2011_GWC1_34_10]|uniref:Uncharacterized protein n=1 Tax=Candidatus Zambryskibacteria bacterium RIFCSPLOWO2_01_FULL_35_19 TaxID=1802757 RepID=A0A1G2TYF6_9BACT|nr:MAG: hypothetical protein UR50_C0003G0030 [Parcubacteria group bacterium GW2011_GWC1_34_10]OHA86727.1 MAG: hypothetical protein A2726_00110 [Candidatus Zambryskibacteria bacterium RIFCSPHIGHO2_01_FULL_35_32]OHB02331.1 MAG: hypothetical protein A3A90_00860 [Candidatus Zambryskibacteria bacterium RIFCSPLOWO2_01_FULL_35_19]
MNSIEDLRDYLLADLIKEIESLNKEDLIRQLIKIKSKEIEFATPEKILKICQQKNHDRDN